MSNYSKLLSILELELDKQNKLLRLLAAERAAIVVLDQVNIEEAADVKKALFADLQSLGDERTKIVNEIAAESNIFQSHKRKVKLSQILEKCADFSVRNKLIRIGNELKIATEKSRSMHNENTLLIRQCLGLIASTVSIMQSGITNEIPRYGENGKLNEEEEVFASAASAIIRQA